MRKNEIFAETEQKLVLGIPPIVRIRPIVVQPQTVLIAFQLEHVRIAIGVGLCDMSSYCTACLKMRLGCILFVI